MWLIKKECLPALNLHGVDPFTQNFLHTLNRHKNRFPNDFYFQLTEEEAKLCSKFQIETLNTKGNHRGTNIKKLPYVFTEKGVAMLSAIIKTKTAVDTSEWVRII